MEVKSKIIKRRTGKSAGKYVVKIEYFDHLAGKTRFMERHADKKGAASDLRSRLVAEIESSLGQSQTGEKMTFADLAENALETYYKPAVIVEGRKIDGVRAHYTAVGQVKRLMEFFGTRPIRQITPESIMDYKLWRLQNSKKRSGEPIRVSTVNRELSAMRRMMRHAYGKGWVPKDIFFGARVIDMAAERERSRLLNVEEEIRLLDACQGDRVVVYDRLRHGKQETIKALHSVDNPKLKAIILLALDSGLRRGEVLKLRWEDIDRASANIRIVGTHTKTERERIVPLSARTVKELDRISELFDEEQPFNVKCFKRSWTTATRLAGIEDLQYRDLRRTAVTRWHQMGFPLALIAKLAGHTQLQTTMKHYTAADLDFVRTVSERMNEFHGQPIEYLASMAVN